MLKSRRFYKHKWVLFCLASIFSVLPRKMASALLILFRYVPFSIGIVLRYCCLKKLCRRCGEDVLIFPGAFLTFLENCEMGNSISIHENCNIGCLGGLRIGDNTMISQGVSILTTEHDYQQTRLPMRDVPGIVKQTVIGNDVWIGAHAVITAGVTIGNGSVIGAGAVVTKNIQSRSVALGVPAKVIKSR
jgi:acetyltransferase-like isoleucine patch superfamily enzyme